MTIFCWDASYMGYKKISNKAKCSMAPRNCPHEMREDIKLKTGKLKTIYYCTFEVAIVNNPRKDFEVGHQLREQYDGFYDVLDETPKSSCRIDGK